MSSALALPSSGGAAILTLSALPPLPSSTQPMIWFFEDLGVIVSKIIVSRDGRIVFWRLEVIAIPP